MKRNSFQKMSFLPENEHLFLHIKIKNLNQEFNDYKITSLKLIDSLRKLKPKSLIIPTFTYTFTKKKNFSLSKQISEVGRFSEEIRKNTNPSLRSLDPVFSFLDINNFGWIKKYWISEAFGTSSIFYEFDKIDGVVINIDLPHLVSSQIHLYEQLKKVPYRFNKIFEGNVSEINGVKKSIKYNFFCRDLEKDLKWNRKKISTMMNERNILKENIWENLPIRWFKTQDMRKFLFEKLNQDIFFLVNEKKN